LCCRITFRLCESREPRTNNDDDEGQEIRNMGPILFPCWHPNALISADMLRDLGHKDFGIPGLKRNSRAIVTNITNASEIGH
jgi:hypothetical protein